MSEHIAFLGVNVPSALDLCLILRSRGFQADEPWYLETDELRTGPNPWLRFAVERGSDHCFINWSDQIVPLDPAIADIEWVRPPLVSVEYRDASRFVREVLAAIAENADVVDTLNGVVLRGGEFAGMVTDPAFDWSSPAVRGDPRRSQPPPGR